LATFEAKLAHANFLENYQLAIRGERSLNSFKAIDRARKNPRAFAATLFTPAPGSVDNPGSSAVRTIFTIIPSGWYEQNKVTIGQVYDDLVGCADPENRRISLDRAGEALANIERHALWPFPPYSTAANYTRPVLRDIPAYTATAQTEVDLARVAIALERHRLRYDKFPESLAKLDPRSCPSGIPADVVIGEPPNYRLNSKEAFQLEYDGLKKSNDDPDSKLSSLTKAQYDHMKSEWTWPRPNQGKN
jgi:hypothetical protein